jgi:hypothetical protein
MKIENIFSNFYFIYESKEGNWNEGGPRDFAKFIGNQVSKLVRLLTGEDGIFSKK